MSIQEQIEEADGDIEGIAERIAFDTRPGKSNDPIYSGLTAAAVITPKVLDDLNDWFEIVDVRVYGDDHIGIPMRYRWSIIRWAENDTDQWLADKGWENIPHLNADSRTREKNELEARYRKKFGDVTVDANFLVLFPDRVLKKLKKEDMDSGREKIEKRQKREQSALELISDRRGSDVS